MNCNFKPEMSKKHNHVMYAPTIRAWIPDISYPTNPPHDMKFLCNEASKLYKSIESIGCVDNFRISRYNDGIPSEAYCEAVRRGCCGSVSNRVTNPVTGNSFIIGFNFGH